jgi:hypothetical protein
MRTGRTTRALGKTRLAPTLLQCVVALLVGIGGTATAAKPITGAQIKDGSVHGRDRANGSVTGKDVKNGSLTKKDFTGSLQGVPGPAGPEGPAGPAGSTGPAGPQGPAG